MPSMVITPFPNPPDQYARTSPARSIAIACLEGGQDDGRHAGRHAGRGDEGKLSRGGLITGGGEEQVHDAEGI
ncbi:hypothetical protein CH63R_12811 [Colletotrichum higginsianum IMI 349063]|uniref:Uncharacterized protein n=1 Tax=Colletotrichum higginsianum (strain IMI 349063) TaxID=759273 RepID=A0A1B7XVB3_COLHI|nr:hypothetical protein CH63R_12811 [Colletotrichum higginsianum IMI 349063]OBR03684.1 hypothetical protein CH63R_12811 [Colletotrichum higginsianum IMI 349063]